MTLMSRPVAAFRTLCPHCGKLIRAIAAGTVMAVASLTLAGVPQGIAAEMSAKSCECPALRAHVAPIFAPIPLGPALYVSAPAPWDEYDSHREDPSPVPIGASRYVVSGTATPAQADSVTAIVKPNEGEGIASCSAEPGELSRPGWNCPGRRAQPASGMAKPPRSGLSLTLASTVASPLRVREARGMPRNGTAPPLLTGPICGPRRLAVASCPGPAHPKVGLPSPAPPKRSCGNRQNVCHGPAKFNSNREQL
jgi:hypothetical protein